MVDLNKPAVGSPSWGPALNENFTTLETELNGRLSESALKDTLERLADLVSSADEWSAELEIDPPTRTSVARARAILEGMPRSVADEIIRVFPSEHAGITLQSMQSGLRMVEIGDTDLLATWVKRGQEPAEYHLGSAAAAAIAFLTAAA